MRLACGALILGLILGLLVGSVPGQAAAAPVRVLPSLAELLRSDMVAKATIRWSKLDAGERVVVEILGGDAARLNPNWSPQPTKLAYDLAKNRALVRAIKLASLGPPGHVVRRGRARPNLSLRGLAGQRTLELLGQGPKGWAVVASWTYLVGDWQRGNKGSIFDQLEPLLDMKPELFDTMKGPER